MSPEFAMLSTVPQVLFNLMLSTPQSGLVNQARRRVLMKFRSLATRMGDPLVRWNLDGTDVMLPLSHNLPFYRKTFPQYSSNVARIAKHVYQKYPDLTFVDIGANIGDTVAILRRACHFPILCIEGNEEFFSVLKINTGRLRDVHLTRVFVGTDTGRVKATMCSQGGTGHVVLDQSSAKAIQIQRLSDILKAQPIFARSKMIKTDTDGFDCQIIRSEMRLLNELRPVLLFEYDPHHFGRYGETGFLVFESLLGIGYATAIIYENNGDYVLTAELQNTALMEDIHQFYSGRRGSRYADVCAFHRDDSDLCRAIRVAELEFFERERSNRA